MLQVKKGHSSINNVTQNTPTSLDMFLQTNFDKIKQNYNENHLFGTLQLRYLNFTSRFESADVQNVSARTGSLAKTDALSHLIYRIPSNTRSCPYNRPSTSFQFKICGTINHPLKSSHPVASDYVPSPALNTKKTTI